MTVFDARTPSVGGLTRDSLDVRCAVSAGQRRYSGVAAQQGLIIERCAHRLPSVRAHKLSARCDALDASSQVSEYASVNMLSKHVLSRRGIARRDPGEPARDGVRTSLTKCSRRTPECAAPLDSLSIIVAACQGFRARRAFLATRNTHTFSRGSRKRALTSSLHRTRAILVCSERGKAHSCSTTLARGVKPEGHAPIALSRYLRRWRLSTALAHVHTRCDVHKHTDQHSAHREVNR